MQKIFFIKKKKSVKKTKRFNEKKKKKKKKIPFIEVLSLLCACLPSCIALKI
jgi:hypothetical protein